MNDDRPSEVLGALPRTRPHRRSQKRPARPTDATAAAPQTAVEIEAPTPPPAPRRPKAPTPPQAPSRPKAAPRSKAPAAPGAKAATQAKARGSAPKAERLRQPAQPIGTPKAARSAKPAPPSGTDILGTAVQAAAELAEIGLSVSARAIRGAVSRLPRP